MYLSSAYFMENTKNVNAPATCVEPVIKCLPSTPNSTSAQITYPVAVDCSCRSKSTTSAPRRFFALTCSAGLEGMVAQPLQSHILANDTYRPDLNTKVYECLPLHGITGVKFEGAARCSTLFLYLHYHFQTWVL